MAVTDQSSFDAMLASNIHFLVLKASLSNTAAGQLFSLWQAAGNPANGATPTSWATCTNALLGSIPYTNPSSPAIEHLTGFSAVMANIGGQILFDRLGHMGGLSGTSTSAQTVNGVIPADRGANVSGNNVEWFLEWYTATGSTGVTATITYTAQDDSTGNTTTVAVAATTRAGRLMPILPAAGESIKSIQTVQLSATTGTAGNFGVTACRRIAENAVSNIAIPSVLDVVNLGMIRIYDSSCLFHAVLCSTTTTGVVGGEKISLGYA